jgi:hypothetical protein
VDALARIAEYLEELPDLPGAERYNQPVRKMQSFQQMDLGSGGSGRDKITADDLRQMPGLNT